MKKISSFDFNDCNVFSNERILLLYKMLKSFNSGKIDFILVFSDEIDS
jgi:hypothetical protein